MTEEEKNIAYINQLSDRGLFEGRRHLYAQLRANHFEGVPVLGLHIREVEERLNLIGKELGRRGL